MLAFSFGGGVQSTAALVLASTGHIPYTTFLFANTGADSENPKTLEYVETVAKPFAEGTGLTLIELERHRRDGSTETLLGRLERSKRTIDIPVRMSNGAPGNRNCTKDFKIRVVAKWLKANGATAENPATVGLGISIDEIERVNYVSGFDFYKKAYPLIDARLSRASCLAIIESAGLPEPPKSSCWFCPFHKVADWQKMIKKEPVLFQKSVDLERMLNERRATLGKDEIYFSTKLKALDKAIVDDGQEELFDGCETGFCMT
jgi:hypothetical protein